MKCPKCREDRMISLPESSEPEGFRPDVFCVNCNIRFKVTKGAIVEIAVLSRGRSCPHCEGTGKLDSHD